MKHPRRNEVFRDVGSTFREPDDPDFIELIETSFEPDAAILLCSDGLSDMIPSAAIERAVRQHAGNPDRVVKTLIDAANKAGGKDNITVVYVEGADFAHASATPALRTGDRAGRRTRDCRREPGDVAHHRRSSRALIGRDVVPRARGCRSTRS